MATKLVQSQRRSKPVIISNHRKICIHSSTRSSWMWDHCGWNIFYWKFWFALNFAVGSLIVWYIGFTGCVSDQFYIYFPIFIQFDFKLIKINCIRLKRWTPFILFPCLHKCWWNFFENLIVEKWMETPSETDQCTNSLWVVIKELHTLRIGAAQTT